MRISVTSHPDAQIHTVAALTAERIAPGAHSHRQHRIDLALSPKSTQPTFAWTRRWLILKKFCSSFYFCHLHDNGHLCFGSKELGNAKHNTLTTTLATVSIQGLLANKLKHFPTLFQWNGSTSVLSELLRRRLINLEKWHPVFKNWDFPWNIFKNGWYHIRYRNAVVYDHAQKCWPNIFVLLGKQKASGSMQAGFTRKLALSQSRLPTCLIARVQPDRGIGAIQLFYIYSLSKARLVEQ